MIPFGHVLGVREGALQMQKKVCQEPPQEPPQEHTQKVTVRTVELHDTGLTHHLCNDTKSVIFPDVHAVNLLTALPTGRQNPKTPHKQKSNGIVMLGNVTAKTVPT